MRYQSWLASSLRGIVRLKRQPLIWAMLGTFGIFCALCGILGTLVLRQFAPNQVTSIQQTLPPAPTIQPVFGLSGQATCRRLAPPTDSPWLSVAGADAQKYQIDPLAFEWQIWQESRFDPNAVSAANAIGIAQFEPVTAASLGIDPKNPRQALDAAARLDQNHLRQFADHALRLSAHYGGSSAHYAYAFMLAAYNAGAGNVEAAWTQSFGSQARSHWPASAWGWLSQLSRETRSYVPAILGCR